MAEEYVGNVCTCQVERSQYTEGWSSKNGFTEISRSVPQGGNRPKLIWIILRDEPILLLFLPIFLSGNSFFLTWKFQYVAQS